MSRPKDTASETELAHLTEIDRRQVPIILTDAGIKPLAERPRKSGGVYRTWPRAESLRVLRASEATLIKRHRDDDAAARAAILEIKMGLKSGRYVLAEDWKAAVETFIVTVGSTLKHLPARYAVEVAAANARRLPELERRAALRAILEPALETIRKSEELLKCPIQNPAAPI